MAESKRIEIFISGDASGLKKAALDAALAVEKLQLSGEKLTAGTGKATEAADRFIEKMKQESIQLSLGDLALRKYHISKLGLTDAALKEANALAESIEKLKQHERAATGATGSQENLALAMLKGQLGADLLMRAFDRLVATYREMKTATQEMQQNEIKQAALIEIAGEKASGKREIIERLAASMARLTKFDDDQVRAAGNQLLTYDLTAERFERVLKVAGDMSAIFGGDLSSNVEQAARIVSAGADSVGLLTRRFRDLDPAVLANVKRLIEMNEAGAAQDAILGILEGKVGGLAEKAYVGLERRTAGVTKAWDDLMKAMGRQIFDEKSKEAGGLELALQNVTTFVEQKTSVWEKGADALLHLWRVSLNPRAAMGLFTKPADAPATGPSEEDLEAQRISGAERDAKATLSRAQADYAGIRKGFRTTREKMEEEIALLLRVGKQANIDIDQLRKDEAAIRAKYDKPVKEDNEARKEQERLQKNRMVNLKAEADAQEDYAAAQNKATEAADKLILGMRDSNEMMKVEIEAIGLSRAERELLINTKQKELALGKARDDYQRGAITALYDEKAALIQVRQAKEDNIGIVQRSMAAWDQFGDRMVDVLMRGKDAIKDIARELAAVFLKKWVLNLAASVTGSSLAGSAAASVGSNTLAGSAMSSLGGSAIGNALGIGAGSIFGGSAAYGAALGTTSIGAGSQAAMLAAQTGEFGLAGLGATGGAAGGTAGSITGMLSAAGRYIAFAVAAYALYKAFASPGGGRKTGGSFQGSYGASGALSGVDPTILFGLKSDEATGGAAAQSQVGAAATAAYALIRNLGGTNQALKFSAGYDSDPRGTAQNRVMGTLTDASGRVLFSERDREIGRDAANIGPELKLTTSRMILAALKSSELPQYLSKILNDVVVESASQTEIDAVIQKLSDTKAAWDGLTAGMTLADNVIADLAGDKVPALKTALAALGKSVDDAMSGFDLAMSGGDAIAIQAAQATLTQAVVNRYQTEMAMIQDIQAGLATLKQNAFEFRMANAERINKYGGSVNIGAIAAGRLTDLRGTVEAGGTPEERMANLSAYVGAIDAWVNAEAAAMQANAQGQSAIAAAQASATEARIAGLQKELELTQQWAGVLASVEQAIDKMRLSASNPLGVLGRQALAGEDVAGLLGQYRGATGTGKVELANRLLAAVNTRQQLNEQAFQRPSDQYLAAYNDNMAILGEIKADAKTEAEKQTGLQETIASLQEQANGYAAQANALSEAANGQLGAIHSQARELAEWAQGQYDLAAGEQEKILNEQLNAITGGLDVGLYQAKMQADMREILASINTKITAFLTGAGSTTATGGGIVTNPVGGGNTGGAQGGGPEVITVTETPLTLKVDNATFASATLKVVTQNGRVIKQTVEQA